MLQRLILVSSSFLAACTGGHDHPPVDEVDCAKETGLDNFVTGLTKTGLRGKLEVKLHNATPAVPVRVGNVWQIEIKQLANGVAGSPVTGASIFATPYMPLHGHTSPVDVEVAPMATDGQYQLDPVTFSMPGVWQTTIEVESAVGNDEVMFTICLPT